MKKKYLAVLLSTGMILSMTGCDLFKKDKDKDDDKKTEQTSENGSQTEESGTEEGDLSDVVKKMEPTVALDMLDSLADCVTLGKYDGIEYKTYETNVTDEEVMEDIKEQAAGGEFFTEVDRAAKKGDHTYITFTGTIDGKSDDNLSSKGESTHLELGSGAFIPGFEDGLVGHKKGETVVLDLTFPDDYMQADYAGKDVQFTVNIDSVKELPEINDAFIKEHFGKTAKDDPTYGKEWNTLEDAKKEVKESLISQKESQVENYQIQDIVSALIDGCEFKDLPQDYVDEYVNSSIEEYEQYATAYNMDPKEFIKMYFGVSYEEFEEQCKSYAKECVKEDIAMWAVAKKEGIELTDEEYEKRINELFDTYKTQYGYDEVSQFVETNGGEDTVKFRLTLILAREWLVEHAVENGSYADRDEYIKTLPWYDKDDKASDDEAKDATKDAQ